MLNSQRAFVTFVEAYCARHGIKVEVRSTGWLIVMQRGTERRFAYGYDLGLNSSVTHRIANDKAATSEILASFGIPCVPHDVFLRPELNAFIPPTGSWEAMLALLRASPQGLVVKPNEGTSGHLVFRIRTKPRLEHAVNTIFAANLNIAISPYLTIDDEVRVVLVDEVPVIVYAKRRPSVVGDGVRSVLELALAMPTDRLSAVFSSEQHNLDKTTLDSVLPAGETLPLHWRHNLESGAEPVLLEAGETREACERLATQAAHAIGMRFGSIDVVRVDGVWRVLEINSGVMMEQLNRLYPALVEAAYTAALDRVFADGAGA